MDTGDEFCGECGENADTCDMDGVPLCQSCYDMLLDSDGNECDVAE